MSEVIEMIDKRAAVIEERKKASETRIFKAVFPKNTNHYDTLFGGTAMQYMDEVAFITATRFTRKRCVTVSSDKIDFKMPIPGGTLIELVGNVTRVGNTSIDVAVQIYVEYMDSDRREKAIEGNFTLVAIDGAKRPTAVIDVK